jgi:sporulation protein YlmC with PRC-barrel domain
MRLEIGNRVRCADGVYGELTDIVIDPLEKRVTHLVVQPEQGEGGARLVPIRLAKRREDGQREIELACTLDEAQAFESVHEFAYLRLGESPADDPDWDVGVEDVLAMPYYAGLDDVDPYWSEPDSHISMYYDRVPKGEVEVRRASAVISADGHSLGEVDGFVVDADGQITHFVLERGHLWGRREVTIPIGAVARVESDLVHVALSKDEVGALPAVRVGRHG